MGVSVIVEVTAAGVAREATNGCMTGLGVPKAIAVKVVVGASPGNPYMWLGAASATPVVDETVLAEVPFTCPTTSTDCLLTISESFGTRCNMRW